MSDDELVNFVKDIAHSDAVEVVKGASSIYSFAKTLYGFFADDSTKTILDRIDALELALFEHVNYWGSLLLKQIRALQEEVREQTVHDALADAQAALRKLAEYKHSAGEMRPLMLNDADTLSIQAVERIKIETDPYYIGGLATAGNARVYVIRALDPTFHLEAAPHPAGLPGPRKNPVFVREISDICGHMEGFIGRVIQSVEASHYVIPTVRGKFPNQIVFYAHASKGVLFEKYSAGQEGEHEDEALANAEHARASGVAAELRYIGIPIFKQTVETWRHLIRR